MIGSRRLRHCAAVVAAALLAGCTGEAGRPQTAPHTSTPPVTSTAPTVTGAVASPATSTAAPDTDLPTLADIDTPAYQPADRTEELTAQIDRAGKPTLQNAIDAMDLYQSMPGATSTSLPPGEGLGGTVTLAMIDRVYSQLTPEQRAVVDKVRNEIVGHVKISADGVMSAPAPGPGRSGAPATTAKQRHYGELATQVQQAWKTHRPDLPTPAVTVAFAKNDLAAKEGLALMSTLPSGNGPGTATAVVTVYPVMYNAAYDDNYIKFTFAHEIFHGIQFAWAGGNFAQSFWVQEGSAEWAAYDLYRARYAPPATPKLSFLAWFTTPGMPLGNRQYSAWPFFESAKQYGLDPYPDIKAMISHGQDDVAGLLAVAGLTADPFASFRSSQSLRKRSAAKDFFLSWPGPNAAAGPTDTGLSQPVRGRGKFDVMGGEKYSHPQKLVGFTSAVDTVTLSPEAVLTTLTTDGPLSVPPGASVTLCVKPGACTCPDSGTTMPQAVLPLVVSLPEQAAKPVAHVVADKFDKRRCKKPNRSSRALGDPHLATFDGANYNLISQGEFVLLSDPVSKLRVQIRVQDNGLIFGAAIGSGDGHRVTLIGKGMTDPDPVLRLDGKSTAETDLDLGAGVRVTRDGSELRVTGPDGLAIGLHWHGGINLTAIADGAALGRLEGLLGNGNGVVGDDLRRPDGTAVGATDEDFAKAWWVTDSSTLFDYEPGQTTESFRKPAGTLPEATQQLIDECRKQLGPDAIDFEIQMCAMDLALTGNRELITVYTIAVQDRTTGYPDLAGSAATATATAVPTTSTAGPPGSAVPSDGAALTVTGVLDSSGQPSGGTLTGSLNLAAGTVLVTKTTGCPADRTIWVKMRSRTDQKSWVQPLLCDPRQIAKGLGGSKDTYQPGEAYVFVPVAGDYDVALSGDYGNDEIAVSAQFFADPAPQLVSAADFDTKGFTGTVGGIGHTVLAWSKPGDKSITRTASGDIAELCVKPAFGLEFGQKTLWDLNPICGHNPDQGTGPYQGDGQIPYLIFARTSGTHRISITVGS